MPTEHDPFQEPRPKDEAPYHLEDMTKRTDERDKKHVANMKKMEDIHRANNKADPTQRPWKQAQTPFYLEGVVAEKPK